MLTEFEDLIDHYEKSNEDIIADSVEMRQQVGSLRHLKRFEITGQLGRSVREESRQVLVCVSCAASGKVKLV